VNELGIGKFFSKILCSKTEKRLFIAKKFAGKAWASAHLYKGDLVLNPLFGSVSFRVNTSPKMLPKNIPDNCQYLGIPLGAHATPQAVHQSGRCQ